MQHCSVIVVESVLCVAVLTVAGKKLSIFHKSRFLAIPLHP